MHDWWVIENGVYFEEESSESWFADMNLSNSDIIQGQLTDWKAVIATAYFSFNISFHYYLYS